MTSITGSANPTPGVARTVSRTSSGNPVSPDVISRVDLPANRSTVAERESSRAAFAVRTAKNTATPKAMPKVVMMTRSPWVRHCFEEICQSAGIIIGHSPVHSRTDHPERYGHHAELEFCCNNSQPARCA